MIKISQSLGYLLSITTSDFSMLTLMNILLTGLLCILLAPSAVFGGIIGIE